MSALSFFSATNYMQRFIVARNKNGEFSKMCEEALASRMQLVLDAELTALVSIPLSATIVSPGIGYDRDSISWPAEAAGAALLFVGLGKVCERGA